MQLYPAIKATMGRWEYFLVRMSMREIAENVKYAEDIHEANQLSEAIQRELKKSRATREIARYLVRQPDRFFSSIVVAALEGDPHWHPVTMAGPEFSILADDAKLAEAFGILTFNGEQDYYALDGQHRLAAIRNLLEGETDFVAPDDFRNEQVPVIIVTPRFMEDIDEFMVRYRRLFGNLNRHAKPMSKFDTYVMDEDDAIAIITRRLVSQHSFFQSVGSEFDSSRVKMKAGKNVPPGSPHWTSFESLYALNCRLLSSASRRNEGWDVTGSELKEYVLFRAEDDEIDRLERELFECWDALLEALPVLHSEPTGMRVHNPSGPDDGEDNVLFWPIVQELLMDLARALIDAEVARRGRDFIGASAPVAEHVLAPLDLLCWDAHEPPWRHVLLVGKSGEDDTWVIASEDRKGRMRVMERILRWQLGLDTLSEEEIQGPNGLHEVWKKQLPLVASDEVEQMWDQILDGVLRR